MSKGNFLEVESEFLNTQISLEKAHHLIESFINKYKLNITEEMDNVKSLIFAEQRDSMFLDAEIIHDYIEEAEGFLTKLGGGDGRMSAINTMKTIERANREQVQKKRLWLYSGGSITQKQNFCP